MGGERLRHAAHATTEIECSVARNLNPEVPGRGKEGLNVPDSGGKELVRVPLAALATRDREYRPHRIFFSEELPVAFQLLELHLLPPFAEEDTCRLSRVTAEIP